MTDRLKTNGWMVGEADLEHGYDPYNAFDRVCVFRNPTGWSTWRARARSRLATEAEEAPRR